MIVLSAGMPRAGTGWYYNLIHDMLVAAGFQDARKIRQQYHLQRILTEVNCLIPSLATPYLLPVLLPAQTGNTFAIKTHAPPKPFARLLIRRGVIHPTYIYRDPRDALLSAIEYGQRGLMSGISNTFSRRNIVSFETALPFMSYQLQVWDAWTQLSQALHVRYEDLLTEYDHEVERLTSFLGLEGRQEIIKSVADKYRPEGAQQGQRGLHFRQGKIGRFREVLSPEQQQICTKAFAPYLRRMGYSL
ncbi:MAG: sulfotransferase domain-containing protein [Chloroflexota bacterium]